MGMMRYAVETVLAMGMRRNSVGRAAVAPSMKCEWDGAAWSKAEELRIDNFHPESSGHRPDVRAKLLYDDNFLYAIFKVEDRFVRCVRTEYQQITSKDSCVELFVKPKPGKGYFAFETNCGGTMLFYYITDATRTPDGFKEFVKIPWAEGRHVMIAHSAPVVVEPEIAEPFRWTLQLAIPFKLFEKYVGPLGDVDGQVWEGNLFKCADESSQPHWASWNPIGEELNFHAPQYFGELKFTGRN